MNNIIVVRISLGLPLITILLSASIDSYSNHTAYAHNFVPNDSATFLTRVYRGEVELSLAKDNFPSNVTLALDHIDNAAEVMNKAFHTDEDIIDDTDFIAKYKKALSDTNSTVHALVLANIVDQVLREYGDAFDIDYDLTNMSNMIMTPATTTSMSDVNSSSLSSISMNTSMHSNMSEISSSKLVNIDDYQSVQRLSEVAYLIFKNKLLQQQSLSYSNNTDNDNNNGNNNNSNNNIISKLEKRMVDLKNSVNDKVSAQELMALVHTQIHPSLQLAYNLRLIQQQ